MFLGDLWQINVLYSAKGGFLPKVMTIVIGCIRRAGEPIADGELAGSSRMMYFRCGELYLV